MAPRTRAEAERAFEELSRLDSNIRRDESISFTTIDRVEKLVKWAVPIIAFIAGSAVWTGKIQWEIAKQTEQITDLIRYRDNLIQTRFLDQTVIQSIQNAIDSNRKERMVEDDVIRVDVTALKSDTPKTAEMWFMQQHGISNKESYLQTHGRPAPSIIPDN